MVSNFRLEPKSKSVLIKFTLLLLPVLILVPGLGAFPYPNSLSEYSDITVSHFPITYYIRYALAKWQAVPMWSPDILSGYPLIADPLSGLMYPPGWLALVLPLPHGFNLLVIFHLIWGGIGIYFLSRAQGLSDKAAIFAAIAFEAMPKLFAHYGAGHITLIYAVSWTPWLLYFRAKNNENLIIKRNFWNTGGEGCILGVIFLADPRWAIYAGLLWWGYGLFWHSAGGRKRSGFRCVPNMIYQSAIAALIAAPLALPLQEYTKLSTRTNLNPDDVMTFSLPPARLLGLIYPDLGGFHEWVLYPGAIVGLLCLMAVIWNGWRERSGFWLWIALLSLLLALGDNLPVGTSLAKIPGFNLMRVPPRSLFMFGMACSILAANGLDKYLEFNEAINPRKAKLALVTVVGFIILLTVGMITMTKNLPVNIAWGSVMFVLSGGFLWWMLSCKPKIFINGNMRTMYFFAGFIFLLLVDLGVVDTTLFKMRPTEEVFEVGSKTASFLQKQPGNFRVYSPSYSLPQSTASIAHLQLVDGVHPLQLASYAGFMAKASGIPQLGYSVTLPPYKTGNPKTDNISYVPDTDLLGLLNVRFIVSEFNLSGTGLKLLERFDDTRLYENSRARQPVWVITDDSTELSSENRVLFYSWTPNQIVVEAIGPGLLVLSEINYPGWLAYIDGDEREIKAASDILRSVQIEDGVHKVVFTFHPVRFYIGLGMALVGLFMTGIGLKG